MVDFENERYLTVSFKKQAQASSGPEKLSVCRGTHRNRHGMRPEKKHRPGEGRQRGKEHT